MPRNSSGIYTLPSGNPVVSGTLIEASWANTTLSDLSSAMTGSLSRGGEGGMTAALRVVDGTLSVPGLAFVNETSSGLYRAGAGDFRLSVLGTAVAQFLSTGVSVTGTLGVSGATTLTGALTLSGGIANNPVLTAGTANGVAFLNGSKAVTSGTALTFDGANLGVGTSSPAAKLQVNAGTDTLKTYGSSFNQQIHDSVAGAFSQAVWQVGGVAKALIGANSTNMLVNTGGDASANIVFATGSGTTERMRLDSSGNLGLGVTPSAWSLGKPALEMRYAGNALIANTPNELFLTSNAYYNSGWKYGAAASTPATYYVQYQGAHQWQTAPSGTAGNTITFTQAMTLDASGRLGIGTTSPTTDLSITNSAGPIIRMVRTSNRFELSAENDFMSLNARDASTYITFKTADTERARIDSSGNLLVGTTSVSTITGEATAKFQAAGNAVFGNAVASTNLTVTLNGVVNKASRIGFAESGGIKWLIGNGAASENGVFEVYSNTTGTGVQLGRNATSWSAASDERLKTTLVPFENAAAKVAALRAGTARYLTDVDSMSRSFLSAQSVQAVLPEAVDANTDEQATLSLRYTDVIPLLVAAIQEQQTLITALTARITALESI